MIEKELIQTISKLTRKEREVRAKFIQSTWEAFFSAFDLMEVRPSYREQGQLRIWLTKAVVSNGTDRVVPPIKYLCNQLRWIASRPEETKIELEPPEKPIGTPKPINRIVEWARGLDTSQRSIESLVQLSFVGRALGYPSKNIVERALLNHKTLVSTPSRFPEHLKDGLQSWVKSWVERFWTPLGTTSLRISSSATADSSRKIGGLNNDLRQAVNDWGNVRVRDNHMRSKSIHDRYPTFRDNTRINEIGYHNFNMGVRERSGVEYTFDISGPDGVEIEKERIGKIVRDRALELIDCTDIPEAHVECVAERGYKARIVTKSPWFVVEVGHLLRGIVWPYLERDPRVRMSLDGKRLEAFFEDLRVRPPRLPTRYGNMVLVSSDLTLATDGMSRELLNIIWTSFCQSAGLGDDVIRLGLKLLGPMVLHYPDGSRVVSERGCLMGLPLSWFCLSLFNLWSMDDASKHHSIPRFIQRELRLIVCGDDLGAIMPKRAHDSYKDRIEAGGSSLSKGKHLVSRRLLTFTEQFLLFTPGKREAPIGSVAGAAGILEDYLEPEVLLDVFPVKALVSPGHFDMLRSGQSKERPPWVNDGPSITGSIPPWLGDRKRKEISLLCKVLRPSYRQLLEVGIPPDVPRFLGGGGFPPQPGKVFGNANKAFRRCVLSLLIHRDLGVQKLSRMWRVSGSRSKIDHDAETYAMETINDLVVVDNVGATFPIPARGLEVSSKMELMETIETSWKIALTVGGFDSMKPSKQYSIGFSKFLKKWRAEVSRCSARVTGGVPRLNNYSVDALEQKLLESDVYTLHQRYTRSSLRVSLGIPAPGEMTLVQSYGRVIARRSRNVKRLRSLLLKNV